VGSKPKLPPGQRAIAETRKINLGHNPPFDPESWNLEVTGLVETPLKLSWDEFRGRVDYRGKSDLHCVEGWSVLDIEWEGVRLSTLLEQAGVKPEARFVFVESDDGYSTSFPLSDADEADVALVIKQNGEWLTPDEGRPVRLVVPHRYAYKAAKFVRRIVLVAEDRPGYWETRGYHNEADPWKEQRKAPG